MKYNLNIREEFFGATLNNIEIGKREYITKEELYNIMENGIFFKDSLGLKITGSPKIKFTPLVKRKFNNGFSFPDIAYIELTRKCNLKCQHCLNDSGKQMKDEMTLDELLTLIKTLADLGLQEVRLTGGEPLLFNGIYDLIKISKENGLYVSLGTNGTLITESVAKKLRDAGLDKAVVSIDGTEEMHDRIRGNGNYKKAIDGLMNLKKQGIVVRINSVIMKSNMDDIIKFAKNVDALNIPLFIRRFIESGRGEQLINNTLTKEDYDYIREQLKNEITDGQYVNGHYLRNDEGIHSRIKLPFEIKGCKAGQRAIAIMPDGSINLCGFLAAQGFENIANIRQIDNWIDFWDNLQTQDKLHYLREKLDSYNSTPNIQETYCLAYIERQVKKKVLK